VVIEETGGQLQDDYAHKLGDALRQAREESDAQLRLMREESDSLLEHKVTRSNKLLLTNCNSVLIFVSN